MLQPIGTDVYAAINHLKKSLNWYRRKFYLVESTNFFNKDEHEVIIWCLLGKRIIGWVPPAYKSFAEGQLKLEMLGCKLKGNVDNVTRRGAIFKALYANFRTVHNIKEVKGLKI